MNLNFREALLTLSRALPLVLFRAGVFVAGGFMVIVLFAMLMIASRLAGNAALTVAVAAASLAVLGGWIVGRLLQRFFLYRQRAAMLLAFSDAASAAGGMDAASERSKNLIPDYPRWKRLNRVLRQVLSVSDRNGEDNSQFPMGAAGGWNILDLPAAGSLVQAILALAYAHGGSGDGRPVPEGLALYVAHGKESRLLARRWALFSAAGFLFLFLCLAVPNWFFFRSAGAPTWIGLALAAAISWLLHQAFIAPFALAGVCSTLLQETRGRVPDPELCDRLAALFPDAASAQKQ